MGDIDCETNNSFLQFQSHYSLANPQTSKTGIIVNTVLRGSIIRNVSFQIKKKGGFK